MKAAILSIVMMGAIAALHISGNLMPYIMADSTFITAGLIGFAFICTILSTCRRKLMIWVIDNQVMPMLGLLGTVLGFMIALNGIVGAMEATKLAGVETALITTAAGMIAHLWLLVVREATR